jgi:hypothetical protein
MNDNWQDFTVLVAPDDHPLVEAVLRRQVDGHEAIYSTTEQLGIVFPTKTDESMFRLALLGETTMHDIHPLGHRHYVVASRLSEEIADHMGRNMFEATITPIIVGNLELRSKAAFDRIEADLATGRAPFALMPAQWPI